MVCFGKIRFSLPQCLQESKIQLITLDCFGKFSEIALLEGKKDIHLSLINIYSQSKYRRSGNFGNAKEDVTENH